MGRKELRKIILEATDGVLETVTDLVLYEIFISAVMVQRPTMRNALFGADEKASVWLKQINYRTIARAFDNLVTTGLTRQVKGGVALTNKGEDRIKVILPSAGTDLTRRKGEVYLVAYDIGESSHRERDAIRRFLKRVNAVMIQESLFIVLKNPQAKLEEMVVGLPMGQVLITKLGADTLIGGKTLQEYLWEAYKIKTLEGKYLDFIEIFSKMTEGPNRSQLDFAFNKILAGDPSLPSEFLSQNWAGYEAQKLYYKLLQRPLK